MEWASRRGPFYTCLVSWQKSIFPFMHTLISSYSRPPHGRQFKKACDPTKQPTRGYSTCLLRDTAVESTVLIQRRNDKRRGGWEQVVLGQQIQGFSRSPGMYGQRCRVARGPVPTRNRCSKQWDVPPLWSEWTAELFTTKGPFSSAAGPRTMGPPTTLRH